MCVKSRKLWNLNVFQGKKGFYNIIKWRHNFFLFWRMTKFSLVARHNWGKFCPHPKLSSGFTTSHGIFIILFCILLSIPLINFRGVLRTQLNIYDGPFLWKQLKPLTIFAKKLYRKWMFGWVLNTSWTSTKSNWPVWPNIKFYNQDAININKHCSSKSLWFFTISSFCTWSILHHFIKQIHTPDNQ